MLHALIIFTVVEIHFLFNKIIVIRRILVQKVGLIYYTDQPDDRSEDKIIIQLRKIMLLGRNRGKRQTSVSIFTGHNNRGRRFGANTMVIITAIIYNYILCLGSVKCSSTFIFSTGIAVWNFEERQSIL